MQAFQQGKILQDGALDCLFVLNDLVPVISGGQTAYLANHFFSQLVSELLLLKDGDALGRVLVLLFLTLRDLLIDLVICPVFLVAEVIGFLVIIIDRHVEDLADTTGLKAQDPPKTPVIRRYLFN